MENWFVLMIVFVSIFACAAIGFGIYAWILHRKYPKTIRAKVMRMITLSDGRYQYCFVGKDNGRRHMFDSVVYKDKKFKVGEKVMVHIGADGETCRSAFPIWPIFASVACIILAVITILSYYANQQKDATQEENSNGIYQETGYYIVTDTDTLMYGDNIGLTIVNGAADYVSTGDYGSVIFIGQPTYNDKFMPVVQSLGDNIQKDGTVNDLPNGVAEQVKSLGYKIDETVTDSEALMPSQPEDTEHDHDHDHDDENGETTAPTTEETTAPTTTDSTQPKSNN